MTPDEQKLDGAEQRRAGRREANLRSVNVRIVDAVEAVDQLRGEDTTVVRLLCECALDACDDVVDMEISRFHAIRAKMDLYLVVPGHVLHEVEDPVDSGPTWMTVRKRGAAAAAARAELGEART